MLETKTSKSYFFELKGLKYKSLSNRVSIIIIIVTSIFLYANTFTHEFVYDDLATITKNSYVKNGVNGFKQILTEGSWDGFNAGANIRIYRPFQLLAFAIQYEFFQLNPTPYHIIHVLCYALLNALLFLLLKQFWQNKYPYLPLLIVLLFAVHPVHVEVVANLKGSADLFGMLHATVAFLFLFYYTNKKKILYLILASFFYFLSLISKEIAVTYIAIFPLAMYFFTDLKLKRIIINTLPFIVVILMYLLIRSVVFKGSNAMAMTLSHLDNILLLAETSSQEIGTRLYGLGKNLQLLIFPHPLRSSYVYDDIPLYEAYDFIALSTLLTYIFLVILCIRYFFKRSILIFGFLFYLLSLSLFSNTIVMMPSIVSERWLLIPSFGFAIVIGVLIYRVLKEGKTIFHFIKINPIAIPLLCSVLFLFSFKTIERNFEWENDTTLFAADIKTSPNNQIILRAHGQQLMESGDKEKIKESIYYLEKAQKLAPNRLATAHNLGKAYFLLRDYDNSIRVYSEVVKKSPNKYESVFALGLIYNAVKRYNDALNILTPLSKVASYKDASKFKEQLYTSYTNIGLQFLGDGRVPNVKKSISYFKNAKALYPNRINNTHNLGIAYYLIGDLDNAISTYESIYTAKPDKYDSAFALGLVYNSAKRHKDALAVLITLKDIEGYKNTTRLNKQLYTAYMGLGRNDLAKPFAPK